MAKLSRVYQRLFGSTSGLNQVAEFGSLAASAPVFTTNPTTIQSLSNWLSGWSAAILAGNAPAIEDMNAVCLVYAYQLGYLFQDGVPEWDATTVYFKGSRAKSTTNGIIYTSLTDNNTNNAVTDTANWAYASVYSAIAGSAAQVAAGLATHSTWASAISAASAGGTVKILPGAWTENVTLSKQLDIEGSGFGSVLTGTFTFNGVAGASLRGIKISSTITFDATTTSSHIDRIWQTGGLPGTSTIINNDQSNFVGTVFPV